MASPTIVYNGKTITLPKKPFEYQIDPFVPRSVNITLSGVIETLRLPRLDIKISLSFRASNDAALRYQLDNFWQWAQQGNAFQVVFDSTKVVSTTISALSSYGSNSVTVVSTTGITVGEYYVLRGGPNYQVVRVFSVVGLIVTFYSTLDFNFASGSVFRDIFCWQGIVREDQQHTPIEDITEMPPAAATPTVSAARWKFEFYEKVA